MKWFAGSILIIAFVSLPAYAAETTAVDSDGNPVIVVPMPQISSWPVQGDRALKLVNNDAYKAVAILTPMAASGDFSAQLSISVIMQGWLRGVLPGRSDEPFTWWESWTWMRLAASQAMGPARRLGAVYSLGENGLPKNEALGGCLQKTPPRPVESIREHVDKCFLDHGDPEWLRPLPRQ